MKVKHQARMALILRDKEESVLEEEARLVQSHREILPLKTNLKTKTSQT